MCGVFLCVFWLRKFCLSLYHRTFDIFFQKHQCFMFPIHFCDPSGPDFSVWCEVAVKIHFSQMCHQLTQHRWLGRSSIPCLFGVPHLSWIKYLCMRGSVSGLCSVPVVILFILRLFSCGQCSWVPTALSTLARGRSPAAFLGVARYCSSHAVDLLMLQLRTESNDQTLFAFLDFRRLLIFSCFLILLIEKNVLLAILWFLVFKKMQLIWGFLLSCN